jgi:hypothetical protein
LSDIKLNVTFQNGVASSPREGIEFAVGLLRDMLSGGNESVLGAWAQNWVGEREEVSFAMWPSLLVTDSHVSHLLVCKGVDRYR